MPTIAITDRWLATCKAPKGTAWVEWFDTVRTSPPGFGVRISRPRNDTKKVRKTYFLKIRSRGKQIKRSLRTLTGDLATYPGVQLSEAREIARELVSNIRSKGIAGLAGDTSFLTLATKFCEEYSDKHKRSSKEDRRILLGDLYFNSIHHRVATEVDRAEIADLLRAISKTAPVMANRCLAAIRRVYNWAIRNGQIRSDYNPAAFIERPGKETVRDRVYSDEEICNLWDVFGGMGTTGNIFKLCLITGQRLSEVSGLEWAEIGSANYRSDPNKPTTISVSFWTIPGNRTKNSLIHGVPFSPLATQLIEGLERTSDLFCFESPVKKDRPYASLSTARRAVKRKSGIEDFWPHDLRRTAFTRMESLGIDRFICDRITNHTETGVAKHYGHYSYTKEKAEALDAWAVHLQAILAENVVPIGSAKRKA
jgi:integrase